METNHFEKIVYGAMTLGFSAIVAGTLFVIDITARLAVLESRNTLLTGVQLGLDATAANNSATPDAGQSAIGTPNTADNIQRALAEGCSRLFVTFDTIIAKAEFIGAYEQQRLDLLNKQIELYGCAPK